MIPPKKRKDKTQKMDVHPDLKRHLVELAESGAIGGEPCSYSQAIRVLLPAVMSRMEAGETLAPSPYERLQSKACEKVSFRHTLAFAERVEALRVSDEGGRGGLTKAAFWVELLGRAVALARAGELEARAVAEPDLVAAADAVPVASAAAAAVSLSPEQWAELQQRFQARVAENRAVERAPALLPVAPVAPANEPSPEAVFTALMRAQRAILAAHADRPAPSGAMKPDADLSDLVEEGVKLFTEMLGGGDGRGR